MVRELFAVGHDGTRIYVRSRERAAPPPAEGGRLTAVLCDGIACDGFIWKYLWDDLARIAGVSHVAHWNYRGHGRSGRPRDPRSTRALPGRRGEARAARPRSRAPGGPTVPRTSGSR